LDAVEDRVGRRGLSTVWAAYGLCRNRNSQGLGESARHALTRTTSVVDRSVELTIWPEKLCGTGRFTALGRIVGGKWGTYAGRLDLTPDRPA